MPRTAVLYQAHSVNAELLRRFRSVTENLPDGMDAFLALDATRSRVHKCISKRLAKTANLFLFSRSMLTELPYRRARENWSGRSIIPGLQDLVPQLFRRLHPGYDYIYVIEYDVLFNGRWSDFFKVFQQSDAALLATNISPKPDVPKWVHFDSFQTDKALADGDIVRAFLPICRYSDVGLDALEERYARGWSGHPEVLVPTCAHDAGLRLEDFGGDGPFVSPSNLNRFYTSTRRAENYAPGSFVFIPAPSEVPDDHPVLLHPCKTSLNLDLRTLVGLLVNGRHDVAVALAQGLSDPRVSASRS